MPRGKDGCYQVPAEQLAKVLRHAELQQRLSSCSLVCRSWRSAAAAATPDISITVPKPQLNMTPFPLRQLSSLEAWLQQHGGHLSSLAYSWGDKDRPYYFKCGNSERPKLHLACQQLSQLQRLTLKEMLLLPDAATTAAAAAAAATEGAPATYGSVGRQGICHSSAVSQRLPHAVAPQLLSGLSSITRLQLSECTISGWAGGLAGLSLLTQLQHLQLAHMQLGYAADESNAVLISAGLGMALPRLVHLTYLNISEDSLSAAALQGLGKLQQLRELRLCGCEVIDVSQLPASLTLVSFNEDLGDERRSQVVLDASKTATLQQLNNLLALHLRVVTVHDEANLLKAVSKLTSLTVDSRFHVPHAPFTALPELLELRFEYHTTNQLGFLQGLPAKLTLLHLTWRAGGTLSSTTAPGVAQLTALKELHLFAYEQRAVLCPSILLQFRELRCFELDSTFDIEPPALLKALQGMQQLQHLELKHLESESGTQESQGEALQLYSALTASSQLTCLNVGSSMPYGAAQYMFGEGRRLPHLKTLRMHWGDHCMPLFGQGDLATVAAACPALEQLDVIGAVRRSARLGDLSKMTSLKQLKIGSYELNAAQLTAALVVMTQLQELTVDGVTELQPQHVAVLTQLTALRYLMFDECELRLTKQEMWDYTDQVLLTSKASPPDVWRQLRKLCSQDNKAAAAMDALEQLSREKYVGAHARLLQEKQRLQAQLENAQGMIASLQQQLTDALTQLAASKPGPLKEPLSSS